jgi:hypothetical protein
VGGDAAGATLVRSTPPVVYAVVVPALFAYAKDGHPHLWWLLQFESRATCPAAHSLGFRNGPALRYVQISRMTIIKNSNFLFRLR